MNKKLYVGNLPFDMTDAKLEEMFSGAGKVESASVVRDRATGQGRGFAFVEMATEQEAQKAITMFDQYQMDGRTITVSEARPQKERQGGGGGGGGHKPGGRGPGRDRW